MLLETCREDYQDARLKLQYCDSVSRTLKNVMLLIQAEYEQVVGVLEGALKEKWSLCNELSTIAARDSTIRETLSYKNTLQQKLVAIKHDNRRLEGCLCQKKADRLVPCIDQKTSQAYQTKAMTAATSVCLSEMSVCRKVNLQPKQWADLACLKAKARELEAKTQLIEEELATKFTRLDVKLEQEKKVKQREIECEALGLINRTLRMHVKKLKVAINTARFYSYHVRKNIRSNPHRLVDVVDKALKNYQDAQQHLDECSGALVNPDPMSKPSDEELHEYLSRMGEEKSFDVKRSFVDDDPVKETEAEMTMDYIEQFSRLLSAGRFQEAALRAVYSPKGLLRSLQTMQCFKEVDRTNVKESIQCSSHLLNYCKLLLSTIDTHGKEPSVLEAIECVKCAVSQGEIDLVEYWLAKKQLPLVEAIGNILLNSCGCSKRKCQCKNVLLAEVVFKELDAHHLVLNVMIHQGRYATALGYARTVVKFSELDYARLLEEDLDNQELCERLVILHPDISIEKVIAHLVENGELNKAVALMKTCEGQRQLQFCASSMIPWHSSSEPLEKFYKLCGMTGLVELGAQFVGAVLVWKATNDACRVVEMCSF